MIDRRDQFCGLDRVALNDEAYSGADLQGFRRDRRRRQCNERVHHVVIPLLKLAAGCRRCLAGARYVRVMDPFVTLTAAAIATKTLKVGTGVCLVIQRDTIQTAKLVATIDHVSGGRFLFGVGGGWNQDEIEDHGTVFKTRFKKMREQIEAMKEIWTKSEPEYHGDIV